MTHYTRSRTTLPLIHWRFRGGHTTLTTCWTQAPKEKAPIRGAFLMGGTGLEPVTPSLSSWCSPN
jgi:hypothetical protein